MSDSAKAGLGPETLSLIRDIVTGDGAEDAPAAPRAPTQHASRAAPSQPKRSVAPGLLGRTVARVRAFRPTRRQIVWSAVALIVLLRPAWVVLMLVLGLFLVMGVFAAFGSDRVWSGAVGLLKWYMNRAPAKGARLAARIDGFACRWDNLLDRFPDGWVDALYLPDLQSLLDADDRHDAVMATRLQRMNDQPNDTEAAA